MLSPTQKSKSKAEDLEKKGEKIPFQFIEAKQLLPLFP